MQIKKDRNVRLPEHLAVGVIHVVFGFIILIVIVTTIAKYFGF